MNYAEAYLTLRCNFHCGYCINGKEGKRPREEMSADKWIEALNRIDFGDVPITLGGGEPTLHPEFFKILNGIDRSTNVDLLTNLSFDVDEFAGRTSPERFTQGRNTAYRAIRASFHPTMQNPDELIMKAKRLQDYGFPVGIFGINHPAAVVDNMQIAETARQAQVYFFVKDFLGEFGGEMFGHYKYPDAVKGEKRDVQCRTRELLIAPDGKMFRCHRDLYHGGPYIGHISVTDPSYKFRPCGEYGDCNPCDVKLKTNRVLKGTSCQVEIK